MSPETPTAADPRKSEPRKRASPVLRFAWHAAEMIIAMVLGMIALEPVWSLAWPGLHEVMTLHVLVMATNMAIGMAVLMRIRRHGWTDIAEMCGAMYVPFLVLLPFYWTGLMSGSALMTVGHVLMVPAMLVVMLRHRDRYVG